MTHVVWRKISKKCIPQRIYSAGIFESFWSKFKGIDNLEFLCFSGRDEMKRERWLSLMALIGSIFHRMFILLLCGGCERSVGAIAYSIRAASGFVIVDAVFVIVSEAGIHESFNYMKFLKFPSVILSCRKLYWLKLRRYYQYRVIESTIYLEIELCVIIFGIDGCDG